MSPLRRTALGFDYNYTATKEAIARALNNEPSASEVAEAEGELIVARQVGERHLDAVPAG